MNDLNTKDVQSTDQSTDVGAEPQVKTFTQEDVDKIVKDRLAREQKKYAGLLAGKDPKELELDERENAVARKEMQITAKALLAEKGMSEKALELLNYENEEKLQASVELLKEIITEQSTTRVEEVLKGGKPLKRPPQDARTDSLRDAFGLQR